MDVTELCELSSEINGAKIVFSSDDFFGVAENLIKETEPNIDKMEVVCKPPDAWLTKRKRLNFSDFVIIELAARAEIYFISIDTASLVGNVALEFSVQATKLLTTDNGIYQDRSDTANKYARFNSWINIYRLHSEDWPHLILPQHLNPGYPSLNKKYFMISTGQDYTHLRLNIFPDGGITRLRVYGKVLKPIRMLSQNRPTDLISKIYGGNCIAYSSYYNNSHPNNLIKPKNSTTKEDGWCTVRSLTRPLLGFYTQAPIAHYQQILGEEWAIFKLGYSGRIASIEIDTIVCKGDSPHIIQVEGLKEGIIINDETDLINKPWQTILSYAYVIEGTNQQFIVHQNMEMAYVKLIIKPDGCVSRFRVLGEIY